MKRYDFDVFLCHASEDKAHVVRPLANELAGLGLRVWLDEAEIQIGDGLRAKIDAGLRRSRFGVVVLSPNFFKKTWTKAELEGLIALESEGQKRVLPVWHRLTVEDVRAQSPLLAGRMGGDTAEGVAVVARRVRAAIDAAADHSRTSPPIFTGRLTKRKIFELPDGAYLMSNVCNPDYTPIIAEAVPPAAFREQLWTRLRSAGLLRTKYYVFEDGAAYRAYVVATRLLMLSPPPG